VKKISEIYTTKPECYPALFRRYLNISSSFLRLTKSSMPLVAICKITSNLLFVDFDIPTLSRILQPAFFLTSMMAASFEKEWP